MSQSLSQDGVRRLGLFGRPVACAGNSVLSFPEKGFALVAVLALAERRELHRDAVRELLWEDAPVERRAGNLRQLLLRLSRLSTGSPVGVDPSGRLHLVSRGWRIDVLDVLSNEPDVPASELATGVLLEDVVVDGQAFEDWLRQARIRTNEARSAVLRSALDDVSFGRDDRIMLGRKLIACDPADETGYRNLMSAYAEAGDRSSARKWWLECRHHLNREFDIEPSRETSALAARLGLDGSPAAVRSGREAVSPDPIGIPTLVILPPAMLPGNELLDRFGLVVLEEITLGLSQFGSFRVIAAYTSWQMSRRTPTRSGLDATTFDYGVTIGIRSSREPLCATCRLTRFSTSEVLWTVEMEVRADNLQASLNELVRKTVSSLAAAVERAEGLASTFEPGSTGYRMYLEGKRSVGATGLESLRAARKWFKAAVKRYDEYSAALAGLSRTLSMEWLVRGMVDREMLDDALSAAQRAHASDPGSGRATRELGFTSLYMRRHDDSLAYFAKARSLSPHDADLLADYADALVHDGQLDLALSTMRAAGGLNPLAPDYYRWIEATILYRLERYEDAVEVLKPLADSPAIARLMAASLAMLGDRAGAKAYARKVREHYPQFRSEMLLRILPDRHRADTIQVIRGLRMAGLE